MTGWLSDTFVYTGVLIAVVMVLRRPVARVFGPQVAYALWALPFLRLLLPPIVLPASMAPTAAPTIVQELSATPIASPAVPADLPVDWSALALALWLGGAAVFLAWRVAGYRRMRASVLAAARPVGEVGAIRMVESPCVDSPVAFGVGDKVIALPLLFMAGPDLAARDLAIAHELEHHRGRDLAANFAAQALLALHWFNPVAWLGWRAMRYDQEAACDARVVAGRGREERARYAELIAHTGAGRRPNPLKGALAAPMACPVLGDASIVHRLKSLTVTEVSPRRRLVGRTLVAAGALALPFTASLSYAQGETAPGMPELPKQVRIIQVQPGADLADRSLHTREFDRNGTHIVLKTDRVLTDAEASAKVDDALARLRSPPVPAVSAIPPVPPVPALAPLAPVPPAPPTPPGWGNAERTVVIQRTREGGAPGEQRLEIRRGAVADLARARALTRVPEISENCAEGGPTGQSETILPDGRKRIVICESRIRTNAIRSALDGVRRAREQIARDTDLRTEIRREVLEELDEEILELEQEQAE